MLELKIERMAELFDLNINQVPKEIENKHNVLINMMMDKVADLKKDNDKMNKQINSLKSSTKEQPKEFNLEEISLIKEVENIKSNFDNSYDRLKKYCYGNIDKLITENKGLVDELKYYKQRIKELNSVNT